MEEYKDWCEENWDELASDFADRHDNMFDKFCWMRWVDYQSTKDDMETDRLRDEAKLDEAEK